MTEENAPNGPNGAGASANDALSSAEQARLREALLDLCSERGYENLELADLLSRAELPEQRFHSAYADLEDYFCALFSQVLDESLADAERAVIRETGWRARWRGLAVFATRRFIAEPRLAHLVFVDLQGAGERARLLYEDAAKRLFDLIEAGGAGPGLGEPVSRPTLEAIGGAIYTQIYLSLARGEDFRRDIVPRLEKLPFPTWEDTPLAPPAAER